MTDPSSSLIASLIYDDTSDSWRIRAPYNVNWIEEMKRRVPHPARRWLPNDKLWAVDGEFLDDIKVLCDKYLGGWREVRPVAPPAQITPEASHWRAFVELLPVDVLKKAYKEASRVLHPDANGSTEAMTQLNICWSAIKKERNL